MNLYENMLKIFEDPIFDSIGKSEDYINIMEDLRKLDEETKFKFTL